MKYPFVMVPNQLEITHKFTEVKPKALKAPGFEMHLLSCISATLFGLAFVVPGDWKGAAGYFSGLTGAGAILYGIGTTLYPEEKKKYEERLATYNSAKKKFEAIKSAKELEGRLAVLKQTNWTMDIGSTARKGISEANFESVLYKYFGHNIKTKMRVRNLYTEEKYGFYHPDFVYVDRKTGLHIDIEIDEPYDQEGKPIHVVGNAEITRNHFFINRGWVVMRFAEEQICRQPDACCKEIAEMISRISGNSTYLSKFASDVELLNKVNRWSEEDSIAMYQTKYRDTYLSKK